MNDNEVKQNVDRTAARVLEILDSQDDRTEIARQLGDDKDWFEAALARLADRGQVQAGNVVRRLP